MDNEREARKIALKLKMILKPDFINENFYLLPSQLYVYHFLLNYKDYPTFLVPKSNNEIDLNNLDKNFIVLVKKSHDNSFTFSFRVKSEPELENMVKHYKPFYQLLKENLINSDDESKLIKWYQELKKLSFAIHKEIYDLNE